MAREEPLSYPGHSWWTHHLRDREYNGCTKKSIGSRDLMFKKLYQATRVTRTSMYDFNSLTSSKPGKSSDTGNQFHGAIFNLQFSPDGSILAAATQMKSLLLMDPLRHKCIKSITGAHFDAINNIKFLNDHLLATCSDDSTIALWDTRYLSSKLMSLEGHSYWVKNIEYDSSRRLLLTSSYDGSIRSWDIFNPASSDDQQLNRGQSQRLMHLGCIMRMRLTLDCSKMIVCTSEGYILLIHDLNLDTLVRDLDSFQSDLYRLMQKGHSCGFDFGSWFNHLFEAKRNRIELISDFPKGDDAHSITSLDVHPHGWSILTRNITKNDSSEWTCVHDIQDNVRPIEKLPIKLPQNSSVHRYDVPSTSRSRNEGSLLTSPSTYQALEMHVSPVVIISSTSANRRDRAQATILNPSTSYREIGDEGPIPTIYQNVPRLTHFIPELNVGSGVIKELSFSPDGRVIASPYEFGYRILAFNENVSELSECVPSQPRELHEVKKILPHENFVVCTKFSPTTSLIASGCLNGRIVFSQPVI